MNLELFVLVIAEVNYWWLHSHCRSVHAAGELVAGGAARWPPGECAGPLQGVRQLHPVHQQEQRTL
jgi:hypothetical protein